MPRDLPTGVTSRLDTLFERYRHCKACGLCSKRPVFFRGRGNPDADIALITDKPTKADLNNGIILAPPHSKILASMLSPLGYNIDDLWVTTTVLCAPEDGKDPKISEIKACRERLCEELHMIRPKIIIGLGTLAIKALVPKKPPALTEVGGSVIDVFIQGDITEYQIPALITYSLNHLLRNQDTSPGGLWNKFYDHVQKAALVVADLNKYARK